ncbi:MAG: S-methyl-5'-thioadenosine phosphorylase [Thermodesulfovibrionales bacterium]|nr:S-methyl-5'-thioadenosine phosphorylase [Thermodesulfovibrionales bacterium]
MKIGIIAGSGLYDIKNFNLFEEVSLDTPFGQPSSPYKIGEIGNKQVIFLARHGPSHTIPPHKINYRANIWGLKTLGVERIIAINAVGGINRLLTPGDIVLPDQIIDFTFGYRCSTFYEDDKVVHVDFTYPYCSEIQNSIYETTKKTGINVTPKGTYICVNGPRLESAKEIKFFASIGADIVGMTAMPEAILARELEICFGALCIVTNYAAGIVEQKLTTVEVLNTMKKSAEKIKIIISEVLNYIPLIRKCPCKDALKDAQL